MTMLGLLIALIFALLGGLHVYWAVGGISRASAAIPQVNGRQAFTPSRLTTLLVAIALFVAALIVLGRIGMLADIVPTWLFRYGVWGLFAVFLLRAIGDFRLVGLFKRIRDTRFAYFDTRLFTPLCLALAVGLLILTQR
jgi:hypothetical protein